MFLLSSTSIHIAGHSLSSLVVVVVDNDVHGCTIGRCVEGEEKKEFNVQSSSVLTGLKVKKHPCLVHKKCIQSEELKVIGT